MSKMYVTSGTGSQQTLSDIQSEKIPIYDTEQDAEADFANIADDQIYFTKDNGNNNRYVLQSEYKADNTYSTNEVNTGKTWIDGKPIYRKVFYSATNWANNTVIGTINNIENLVYSTSITKNSNNSRTYMSYSDGKHINFESVNLSTGAVVVDRFGHYADSVPSTVIIEYTKTTD